VPSTAGFVLMFYLQHIVGESSLNPGLKISKSDPKLRQTFSNFDNKENKKETHVF
jgi:hypothetical protein